MNAMGALLARIEAMGVRGRQEFWAGIDRKSVV